MLAVQDAVKAQTCLFKAQDDSIPFNMLIGEANSYMSQYINTLKHIHKQNSCN